MSKGFWIVVTFVGALVFVAGLILTIVLTIETGEQVDDSECDAMGPVATAEIELAACITSDDPKVLLGVGPLLLGGAIAGLGIWRWIATAQADGSSGGGSGGDGGGGGGLMGSLQNLQDKAMEMQRQAMESSGATSAGTAAPAPPPAGGHPSPPGAT